MSSTPLIIAHRGASACAPENTLAAFRLAVEQGADGVEFDVQLSKDGLPVVIHDTNLRRTSGHAQRVADTTAAELAKTDVGSWFNAVRGDTRFSGQTVPTLDEVLAVSAAVPGPIYIELKCNASNYRPLVQVVCDMIRKSPLLPRIIVKSFRRAAVAEVRHVLAEVQTAALFEPRIMRIIRKRKFIIDMARDFGAHQISLHRSLATPKVCALAAEAGMPLTIWTADDPKWIARCQALGVGALITNDPAMMLAARDS